MKDTTFLLVNVSEVARRLRRGWLRIFPKYRRLEHRFVPFGEADRLIRGNPVAPESARWRIAPEEDANHTFGWVHLERRERVLE